MGSFNVACSASHISINAGDPCLILPLKKQKYSANLNSSMIVTNEGACGFFVPFCLPIVGTYDDCGNIDNIQESVTTRRLETIVGDIEAWLNDVNDAMIGRYKSEMPDVHPDAMMFIHGDIYDFMTHPDSENNMLDGSFGPFYALSELGFVRGDKIKSEDIVNPNDSHGISRYKNPWFHPSSEHFAICSDSEYFITLGERTKDGWISHNHYLYTLREFAKIWHDLTGHKFDVEHYAERSISDYKIQVAINRYPQSLKMNNYLRGRMNEDALEEIARLTGETSKYRLSFGGGTEIEFLFGVRSRDVDHMFDLYGPVLAGEESGSDELASDISEFRSFLGNMHRANKMLMPAMNGPQFGDEQYVHDLAEKIMEVTASTIKSREE